MRSVTTRLVDFVRSWSNLPLVRRRVVIKTKPIRVKNSLKWNPVFPERPGRTQGALFEKPLLTPSDLIAMSRLQQQLSLSITMRNSVTGTIALPLFAAAIALIPLQLPAQPTNKPSAAKPPAVERKEPAVKKSRSIPFYGNLKTIDKTAKTFSVDKRVIQITSETKILRAEKPATLESGVLGEYVTGSYHKADDGKLRAHSLYLA